MKPDEFEQLVMSIRQAGGIRAGTMEPARVTILEAPRPSRRQARAVEGEGRDAGLPHVQSKQRRE